ncbi:hypothetical protein FT663_03573 [Candidozyma haemuli var. vulneris]|uniref:Anaphase-promoting complex subunit 4 n=1 Tax=Candidozyma haemuli TaxID=45357 RepID=A0A2V1AQ70_9ASCO|nr:hypothetical protein CXQ85_001712 [[Candida] haemuloni]KAF3989547.1 hypothetical protein FT663_03573 [[Candida] haemuloni var. vulneris]KAF3989814.1 hypothetical protein FT662_02594 [[Candida] haemuloni var. vulneris]PVH19935.1 hypothetical protein CXQ85_001712 [[Candida] haemuloni]
MDLLAISMNKTSIWMFRFNGERVYSINNKAQVLDLQWNSSGRFFAVSSADHFINIYDTNTGDLVNKFATNTSLPITLMSWVSVKLDISIGSERAMPFINMFKQDILKDLPKLSHEVNFFDTERAGGVISLQNASSKSQSMSISATNTNEDDSLLDYLLVVNSNSVLTATFNNLFAVPDIELPENCKFIRHEVKDDFFNQYLLAETSSGDLEVFKMEFGFPEARQRSYVLDILKYSSLLISMLNHITDQVAEMQKEAAAFITVFDRYLSNFKDAIAEGSAESENPVEVTEDDLVETLMAIVLMGVVPPHLKDFWLNQFGERGLLRISKLGNELYEATRKTAYAQVILAIEKIIIILSDLRGLCLAAQNIYDDSLGMTVSTLETSVELSKTLLKSFYEFIWDFNTEQESFNTFCNFVKVEIIERLSKEESEFLKAHPEIEVSSTATVEYVDKYMTQSVLMSLLEIDSSKNDVIMTTEDKDVSLIKKLTDLKAEINQTLLPGIQEYIAKKANFKVIGTIPRSSSPGECQIILADENILVATSHSNSLTINSFGGAGQKSTTIDFPSDIISYSLIAGSRALVLLKKSDNLSELVLFKVPDIGSDAKYLDLEIYQVVAFDGDGTIPEPAIMAVTKDPLSSGVTGCIFDKTKRNYSIIRI